MDFDFLTWWVWDSVFVFEPSDPSWWSYAWLTLFSVSSCPYSNFSLIPIWNMWGGSQRPLIVAQWPSIKAGSRDMNASKTEPRTWFLFYRAWFVALRCLLWPVNGQSHHLTQSSFTHLNLEGTFLGVASLTNPKKGRECFTHTLKYSNKVWRILKKEIWNWIFGCLKIQVMSLYLGFPYNIDGYKAFLSFRKSKKNTCQYMCTIKIETNC